MSRQLARLATLGAALATLSIGAACSSSTGSGTGTLNLQLTDAPFSSDSVSRVDIYVVRVDAKVAASDSTDAATGVTDDSASVNGWTTIATPKQKIELLALRNGLFTALGAKSLAAGSYQAFRLVIDPSQSSVTLKNGTVLTSTSSPSVSFPSAARSGIKINLTTPIVVTANDTATTLIDFDVNQSFVQRGNAIVSNGLLFKPVITAKVK
jgi:hypothetical protein